MENATRGYQLMPVYEAPASAPEPEGVRHFYRMLTTYTESASVSSVTMCWAPFEFMATDDVTAVAVVKERLARDSRLHAVVGVYIQRDYDALSCVRIYTPLWVLTSAEIRAAQSQNRENRTIPVATEGQRTGGENRTVPFALVSPGALTEDQVFALGQTLGEFTYILTGRQWNDLIRRLADYPGLRALICSCAGVAPDA